MMEVKVEGLNELIEYFESMAERVERVSEAVESSGESEDAEQEIRGQLGMKGKPRQMPLMDMSKEDAEALIEEEGLDKVIRNNFLVEDLGDYIVEE